jgi:UDP-N-acetylglucosamine--N-acetylmuramyl-(pentapeptide) pyrophosphoryl-undecaprenol N-acetylglucosamine transferase
MVLAARTRRIPAALTEADAHLGLANRLAAPYATRVFLSYPIPGLREPKYRVVGRPIPERSRPVDQAEARRELGLADAGPVLGVFGALAGARSLNELVVEAFGTVGPAVLHVTGARDYEWVRARVERPDYVVLPSTDRIGAAYSAVDLVLARAGGSVWEVAAAGKPAVLVPYPYATADHQTKNAQHFQRAGGAIVAQETELGTVPGLVRSLLGDATRLAAMGDAMRAAARPDAGERIAEELLELARR